MDKEAFSFLMNLFADAPEYLPESSGISSCKDCSLFQDVTDESSHCRLAENGDGDVDLDDSIPDWCPVEIRINAGKRIMAKQDERREIRFCSFCEKSQSEVKKLIAGPGVYICDECITFCAEILEDTK